MVDCEIVMNLLYSARRRIAQTVSLLLLNSGWWPGLKLNWICTPVMQCHACPLSWFACPIGIFIHYSSYRIFPFLAVGMVLLVGSLLGRLLCGWVCPIGFLQDMLYKIPSPKIFLPKWTKNFKYLFLLLFVIILPWLFGPEGWASFCRICPTAAIESTLPALIAGTRTMDTATIVKLAILVVVLIMAVLSSRSFCNLMCPIGALLAPLNFVSYWIVKRPVSKCIACTVCEDKCPTADDPMDRIIKDIPVNRSLDCIVCHDCQSNCKLGQREKKQRKAMKKGSSVFAD